MQVRGNNFIVDKVSGPGFRPAAANSPDRSGEKVVREDTVPREKKADQIGLQELTNALDRINKTVRIFNRSIQFTEHEASGRLWVKVVDTESQEIVREIPPEEILEIMARIEEMVGLLVDERR
jgi:flagellar protein FlaG